MNPYRLSPRNAVIAVTALICAAFAIPASAAAATGHRTRLSTIIAISYNTRIAQDDTAGDDEDKEVPPAQVNKYITINLAMQKDHNLTVEQAASKQGMTVAQFRAVEGKIERDDTLRERVRTALRKAANPKATDSDQ